MKDIHLHSVVVKYDTYEVLSADTDFYAYIGMERLYNTFVELIHPDGRPRFMGIIERREEKPFVVDMIMRGDETVLTYICVSYGKDSMTIEMEAVSELRDGQEMYGKLYELERDLLGLHSDMIFTYDDRARLVRFYTSDFRRCIRACSLKGMIDELRGKIKEEEYDKLDGLITSMRSDSGSFVYTFAGDLVGSKEKCKNTLIKGFAVNGIEYMSVVGYIHRASNKGNAGHVIERDALTGVYSKSEIDNTIRKTIERDKQSNVAICIIDIDYFKSVNDNFGHMMGDKVLKEVATIITSEVRDHGVVGRFGGDEFMVMFYDVEDMELCREKLRSIKNRVSTRYPKSEDGSSVSITLSIGCAVYPKDADNYDSIFTLADYCLYLAKEKGRNRYVIYSAEKHGSYEEIMESFNNNRRIDSRKGTAMGDVLCMIGDRHYQDEKYTPEMLADDLVENLLFERVICLAGEPLSYRCMSGINLPSEEKINECAQVLRRGKTDSLFTDGVMMINDIVKLKQVDERIYDALKDLNIKSMIMVKFLDAAGKPALVSLESTTAYVAWNKNLTYNYRTIARFFSWFEY